jgi:hypothetical protein
VPLSGLAGTLRVGASWTRTVFSVVFQATRTSGSGSNSKAFARMVVSTPSVRNEILDNAAPLPSDLVPWRPPPARRSRGRRYAWPATIHLRLRNGSHTRSLGTKTRLEAEGYAAMAEQSVERRLTARVHRVWKEAATHTYPRRAQIDPADLGADWANCLMIDLDSVPTRSRFSYVGSALRDFSWPIFDRQCISECLEGTLLELVARHVPRILETKEPLGFAGAATHQDADILYRTILLPLSENGRDIDGVLAAIGYREIAIEQMVPAPASGEPESMLRLS